MRASGWRGCSTPTRTIRAAAACTIRAKRATSSQINLGLLSVARPRPPATRSFRSTDVDSEAARAASRQTGGRYALLNPGAAWPNKRWPPARLGAVAAALRARHGLMSVVLWGPGEEALAQEVVAAAGGAALLVAEDRRSPISSRSRAARR